ncbi:hypothetical protein C8J56DRAFT_898538 [Mycena floridula]|nr:hypothetical protein C8J56DRAFT_898538 [Mycena floridula]
METLEGHADYGFVRQKDTSPSHLVLDPRADLMLASNSANWILGVAAGKWDLIVRTVDVMSGRLSISRQTAVLEMMIRNHERTDGDILFSVLRWIYTPILSVNAHSERQPMLLLAALLNPAPATSGSAQAPPGVTVQHNVQLNHDMTLSELWIYPKGARDNVMVYPLRDQDGNELMSPILGQGIKICPFASDSLKNQTHTAMTRESLKLDLNQEMLARHMPAQDILEKTLSLFVTFIDTECPFPEQQSTQYSFQEQEEHDMAQRTPMKAKRGQVKMGLCKGHNYRLHKGWSMKQDSGGLDWIPFLLS